LLCLALGLSREARAQSPSPATPWFEPQTITLSSRYRFVQSSSDEVTANQIQFKDAFRARFNVDRDRRFAIGVGAFSGSSFTSSWDATGIGTGNAAANMYVKQLYVSAAPIRGLGLQAGGLYINHGENSEITSYDDDGYVTGERVTIGKPARIYFDEVSFTRAALDPASTPGVIRRMRLLGHQHYWQAQAIKRFNPIVSASADYTDVAGAGTVRAAVAVHLPKGTPLSSLRFELYRRVAQPADGFALVAERAIRSSARLQVGYADVDAAHGGLNADRFQRGRRVFAIAAIPIAGPLSAQLFATHAFANSYSVTNRTRFDAVLTWDLLKELRTKNLEGRTKDSGTPNVE
jgi:hypothetical protein